MSRVQKLRVFVSERLNAAVEEILAAFEKTLVKYEQEAALCQEVISRQHALLCALHKPLMELPSADAFTQQLSVRNDPPEHQDQNQEDPEPPHIKEEQEREQLQDLDVADIIQFTYKPRCAARPREVVDLSAAGTVRAEPGAAGPHQDVHLVSSETEDSDDYSKDPAAPKPKRSCRPGPPLSCRTCRTCSRTFKARRFLIRHLKAHLREAEPACGLCGERFDAAESLKLHIQTHRTSQRRELENQTRTRSRERRVHQGSQPATNARERAHACDDCGKTFLQVWKKKRHRCPLGKRNPESLKGTTKKS
ncbi:zinc finger protein 135-like [Micropterus dolomieu]|uniref:zinc finger protein 135-like n=1 Tax=Micropterus dolomieu TaxID=147949 RepID=UPI001E8DE5C6|nr:zinc finger protein 135-like [Micropterus dolomieu]